MPTFTFFKIRSEASVPTFEILSFENLTLAKARAEIMLDRDGCDAIEIVDGETTWVVTRPVSSLWRSAVEASARR